MSRNLLPKLNVALGEVNWENYKTTVIGYSDCNSFIPYYALSAHNLLLMGEKRVLEYSLPVSRNTMQYIRNYTDLVSRLVSSNGPHRFIFKILGQQHNIYLENGVMYKDNTVFMCLGIDAQYVFDTPMEELSKNIDYTKFTLFIDNSFKDTAILKNIYKNVDKLYIQPLRSSGVDIVLTARLKQWLFKNNYQAPKFKNVLQMKNHLKVDVPNILIE
jgi:hypothetical protein